MKKVTLLTQGCRLNQSETAALEHLFEHHGFTSTNSMDADIAVINTCTVTENGDADTKKLIRQLKNKNKNIDIALIGCQSQIHKDELLELDNVKWVIGTSQKMDTASIIKDTLSSTQKILKTEKIKREPFTIKSTSIDSKHTRANLKIQDGCDFFCSFCVIPFARGPARSRVFEDIIREAIELADAGHREVVLTGVNIGTYSYEDKNIMDIIHGLSNIALIDRIRISSIEPTTIPKELIYQMRDNPKLCKHLHIPLQAGSDDVLKAMARKYSMKDFRDYITWVYETVPDICIGTDIIVGYPDESKANFDETVANVMTLPLHYMHVFSYSERKLARSRKKESINPSIIKERSKILRDISHKQKTAFIKQFLNKPINVLFEQEKNGAWFGTSDNYIRVKSRSRTSLKNKLIQVTPKICGKGYVETI
ncbi:tRNA (N(6)-L-threonylcarbamoyladenosine(37)-C(2))-methylthiotransferase MtaB [Candidatus Marinamargulisbacteria bacterium SCGC AG-343-D04]|nr:tRNA (N(6)-L-threonylcarbamoyladenosine(37)-C(2))-methylthiotransferase MtaB [Candidatus Marinamargulisbacteria bacterium SCGC AG-343-D04]